MGKGLEARVLVLYTSTQAVDGSWVGSQEALSLALK